jgi:nicotinate-nucleotide adenylyltransferase
VDRILLFGGSFNPLHHGHLIIGRAVAEHLAATAHSAIPRIILIPSALPPHKQDQHAIPPGDRLAPAADRLEMCRRAIAGDPQFAVSEFELTRPGPNYTLQTVLHFRATCVADAPAPDIAHQPDGPAPARSTGLSDRGTGPRPMPPPGSTELCWLIGMDSLNELGTWHRAGELVEACTIVTAARPGYDCPAAAALGRHFTPARVDKLLRHVVPTPRIEISARDIRARVRAGRSIRYLVPDPVRQYIEEQGLYGTERDAQGKPPHLG